MTTGCVSSLAHLMQTSLGCMEVGFLVPAEIQDGGFSKMWVKCLSGVKYVGSVRG